MATSSRDDEFRTTIPFTMHRVTAITVANATAEFAAFGINVQGARVLVVLLQHPGVRVGELAEITCIELSTLSHMLRRFERDGLVQRKRLPDDNRSVALTLTARGRRIATEVHAIVQRHQRTMLAGLTPRQISALRSALARMEANVLAAGSIEAAS